MSYLTHEKAKATNKACLKGFTGGKGEPLRMGGAPQTLRDDASCRGGSDYVPPTSGSRLLLGSSPISSSSVRSERLHPAANVVGVSDGDKNGHPERLISGKPNLDFVFSGRQMESLKSPVEVIDDTSVRLVHINLNLFAGFFGVYFDPNGSGIGVPPIATVTTVTKTMPVTMPVTVPVIVLRMDLGRK